MNHNNLITMPGKKRGDSSPINIFGSDDDEEDEDGSDEAHSDQPIRGARPTHNLNGDDDDEEEDDIDGFVVQDDEAQVELPAEFNMNSHQDLSHQFKIICQLFVHAAVAEDREVFLSMATSEDGDYVRDDHRLMFDREPVLWGSAPGHTEEVARYAGLVSYLIHVEDRVQATA
jgi:hypothetical protein